MMGRLSKPEGRLSKPKAILNTGAGGEEHLESDIPLHLRVYFCPDPRDPVAILRRCGIAEEEVDSEEEHQEAVG